MTETNENVTDRLTTLGAQLTGYVRDRALAGGSTRRNDGSPGSDTPSGDDRSTTESERCHCDPSFRAPVGGTDRVALVVDSADCPGDGDLVASPYCRATVVDALSRRDAHAVHTRDGGIERSYTDGAAGFLLAAGRFAERVAFHDESLAARTRLDPLGAARIATGRAGPVADLAAETGLAVGAERGVVYDGLLAHSVAPTVARERVDVTPPEDATLAETWTVSSGATVRLYDCGGPHYHVVPPFRDLSAAGRRTLSAAVDLLADGAVDGGERAPARAVRRVANEGERVGLLTDVLRRHTRGLGTLEHLLTDDRVSDVFVTAPVSENPVRVEVDGERATTNVHVTADGAAALASRFRRESGRGFSRSEPTLDATVDVGGTQVRVAGVGDPVSDGLGFAFRSHGGDGWTLPRLVSVGSLTAETAALLSVAVERGAAVLVAGTRGAGKTTLLGSLLFELPADVRTVLIEDTPELPVSDLRRQSRDVQRLGVDTDDGPSIAPVEALRSALRLGEGALVVGEVRGHEAGALYEAMRVGAAGSAVLGTIHADGAHSVRERVVSDLGVSASSFAATDLVVTCRGDPSRHVASVEEVHAHDDGVSFAPLYECVSGDTAVSTGRIERGNSRLVDALSRPGESYADLRATLRRRERDVALAAATDRTRPADVCAAGRDRSAAEQGGE